MMASRHRTAFDRDPVAPVLGGDVDHARALEDADAAGGEVCGDGQQEPAGIELGLALDPDGPGDRERQPQWTVR